MNNKITKCIGKCSLHPKDKYCMGCGRTINHITSWRNLTDAERSDIMGKKTIDFMPVKFSRLITINTSYV